jgi:hypothetical protein
MKILDNSLLQMGGGLYIYQSSRLTLFQKCFWVAICIEIVKNMISYSNLLSLLLFRKTSYSWLLLVLRF